MVFYLEVLMENLTLRWAVKEPNKPLEELNFEVKYDNNDERGHQELKLAQKLVGGYVECVHLGGEVKVLCNEDGLAKNLADNCGFVGTLVFVRDTLEEDEVYWGSLTDDDLRKLKIITVLREHMPHPRNGPRVYAGEDADRYYRSLQEQAERNEQAWNLL